MDIRKNMIISAIKLSLENMNRKFTDLSIGVRIRDCDSNYWIF